jgi:YVTN family beta-propeller protein
MALDPTTNFARTIKVGDIPCAIAIDPASNKIYAVNYASGSVTVIDGSRAVVTATIPVGKLPQAIAIDTKRSRIFVTGTHDDYVTVIDGTRDTVSKTLRIGGNPYALAVDEATGNVYSADLTGKVSTFKP